ncbi:MAG TPA: MFS transporter, partial [Ilumatobacteraceae bacterium]|nr:MFS transporter [Ilumatobacteraceae bacterium]
MSEIGIGHVESAGAPRSALGRRFMTVWAGQTVSAIGSNIAGIGMAVFVFLETGSTIWLGVLTAAAAAPYALLGPVLHLVDRWPRKAVMIGGDCVAAVGTAFALTMAGIGQLEIWHLAVGALLGGIGSAFQTPAAQAAVPLLVPPSELGRANGLAQLGPAVGIVSGPLLAAPLVAWWGITAVLVVDLVTFVVAMATVVAVRIDEGAAIRADIIGSGASV